MNKSKLPLIATLTYALVGCGWIIGGHALSDLFYADSSASGFELYKGLAYVAITAAVLYFFLHQINKAVPTAITFGEIAAEFRNTVISSERTLRWLPTGLVIIMLTLALALASGLAWVRNTVLDSGEASAETEQHNVSLQISNFLQIVDLALIDLAHDYATDRLPDASAELRNYSSRIGMLARELRIVDAGGRTTHSSAPESAAINSSGSEHFQYHRGPYDRGFFIGKPQRDPATNTWIISASRAIRSTSGKFIGIVEARLDPQWFPSLWLGPTSQHSSSIGLYRDDGIMLMSNPYIENLIGQSRPETHAWRELVPRHASGVYRHTSIDDGTDRIYAFSHVPNYDNLIVFVEVPTAPLLRNWRILAGTSAGGLMLFIAAVTLLATVLLRQFSQRIAAQKMASELARYPLQNRNPVITVNRAGTKSFINDAAKQLFQSVAGSPSAVQLDDAIQAMATETEPGIREVVIGNRLLSATYTPHPGYCDIYLSDVTQIRDSEKLLRLFFELPFIGMAITSPETRRWLQFNDRLCDILGYPRQELAHKSWAEMTHPDDLAADVSQFERVMAGETDGYCMDKRFVRPDGRIVHATIDVKAVRRSDRSIEYFVATIQDITERKQREQELQQAEERWQFALEGGEHGVWEWNARTNEVFFSHEWKNMLGYADEDIGHSLEEWKSRVHPDDLPATLELIDRHFRGETAIYTSEHRLRCKDGSYKWILDRGKVITRDAEGQPLTVVGTHTDLTEVRAAELRHRESESKFRGIVEQSLVGIYIIDDVTMFYANPRTAEIFGYDPDEILGPKIQKMVHPDDWPLVRDNIRKQLRGEVKSISYEFRGRRRDGSDIHVGTHGSSGEYAGRPVIIGVLQDITERLQNEKKLGEYVVRLEQSIKATTNAISNMVEMRDPYTAGHERRVAEIAAAIGGELGLSEHDIAGLSVIGHVHDVGKIIAPAEILSKPGRLSAAEFEIIKTHAEKGYEILKDIDFPWPVAEAVRQHHERMDGSGYPQGLKGENILLPARILAVADVVESMASHRPYRPALGMDAALAEIEKNAGRLYDPEVAAACLRLFREKNHQLPT